MKAHDETKIGWRHSSLSSVCLARQLCAVFVKTIRTKPAHDRKQNRRISLCSSQDAVASVGLLHSAGAGPTLALP